MKCINETYFTNNNALLTQRTNMLKLSHNICCIFTSCRCLFNSRVMMIPAIVEIVQFLTKLVLATNVQDTIKTYQKSCMRRKERREVAKKSNFRQFYIHP